MALTPEDVRNKQFTTVRFKEGYDLDEVDNFLDEIEESLSAVTREAEDLRATAKGEVPESIREEIRALGDENARLKSELDQSAKALADAHARAVYSEDSVASDEALLSAQVRVSELDLELSAAKEELAASLAAISELKDQLAAAYSDGAAASAAAAVNASPAEQGLASVRILELAQRTADEAVAAARIESEQLLSVATSTSEELVSEAKTNVANITREFESQRVAMERRVEELRAYEREYRGRLRSYLEGQLRELESKNISGDRQVTED
jgi:DivIVA domain-containing protein